MNSHGITWLQRPNGSHPQLAQFTDQNKVFQVAQLAPKNQPETSSPPASSLILHRGAQEHNCHGKQSRHTARCFTLILAMPCWQQQKFVPVSLLHWCEWKKNHRGPRPWWCEGCSPDSKRMLKKSPYFSPKKLQLSARNLSAAKLIRGSAHSSSTGIGIHQYYAEQEGNWQFRTTGYGEL